MLNTCTIFVNSKNTIAHYAKVLLFWYCKFYWTDQQKPTCILQHLMRMNFKFVQPKEHVTREIQQCQLYLRDSTKFDTVFTGPSGEIFPPPNSFPKLDSYVNELMQSELFWSGVHWNECKQTWKLASLEPANFELSKLYYRDVQSLSRLAQLNFSIKTVILRKKSEIVGEIFSPALEIRFWWFSSNNRK